MEEYSIANHLFAFFKSAAHQRQYNTIIYHQSVSILCIVYYILTITNNLRLHSSLCTYLIICLMYLYVCIYYDNIILFEFLIVSKPSAVLSYGLNFTK